VAAGLDGETLRLAERLEDEHRPRVQGLGGGRLE
jgi:hypothetical protein